MSFPATRAESITTTTHTSSDRPGSVVTFGDLGDGRTELVVSSDQRMSDALGRQATAGLGSAFDRLADHLQYIYQKEHA